MSGLVGYNGHLYEQGTHEISKVKPYGEGGWSWESDTKSDEFPEGIGRMETRYEPGGRIEGRYAESESGLWHYGEVENDSFPVTDSAAELVAWLAETQSMATLTVWIHEDGRREVVREIKPEAGYCVNCGNQVPEDELDGAGACEECH